MPGTVKQQHYLPNKSLLAHFTDDKDMLQVYRFQGENHKYEFYKTADHFQGHPPSLGKQGYLYETPDLPTNTLEKMLATIESAYQEVLESKIIPGLPVTEDDESVVRLFVEMLQGRVPAYKDHVDDWMNQVEETGRQMYKAHNQPVAEDWTNQFVDVRERLFAMQMLQRMDIHPMQYTDVCILTIDHLARDMYFFLSDNPVSMVDFARGNTPLGIHPAQKEIEIIVPITRDKAVFMNNCGIDGYREISFFEVDEINLRSLGRAQDFLVSPKQVDAEYYNRMFQYHKSISFVLRLIRTPRGRMAKKLEKIKKAENKARRHGESA